MKKTLYLLITYCISKQSDKERFTNSAEVIINRRDSAETRLNKILEKIAINHNAIESFFNKSGKITPNKVVIESILNMN